MANDLDDVQPAYMFVPEEKVSSCYRHNLAGPEGGPRARWAQRIIVMGLRIGSCVGDLRPDWPCI
jgi:hypothetical protein